MSITSTARSAATGRFAAAATVSTVAVVAVFAAPGLSHAATLKDGTYQGAVSTTKWGPVQVELVVAGGQISTCTNLQHPNDRDKSIQINDNAVPLLNAQVVSAQSAQIQGVNGATVTSDGYRESVQSALDMAAA